MRLLPKGHESQSTHPWNAADEATIEHLDNRPPFYWGEGLERSGVEGIALCCGAWNSSRGNRTLAAWFRSPYCTQRDINARTVALS